MGLPTFWYLYSICLSTIKPTTLCVGLYTTQKCSGTTVTNGSILISSTAFLNTTFNYMVS